jgi:hypothetical protein
VTRLCAGWISGVVVALALTATACGRGSDAARLTELQRVKSDTLEVVLLSPHDAIRHGKDAFVIEFRSSATGNLIDVGSVRMAANMPMPGMPMFGTVDVQRTDAAGRYAATGQLDMAGTWRLTIEWDGPVGKGSVVFSRTVQ